MLTDPKVPTGWFGNASDENGDICNGETATIRVGGRIWNTQRIYSKADDIRTNGASFCLASATFPIPALSGGPIGWAVALTTAVTGGRNVDGRLEMFGVGTDNAVWHLWQENPHAGPWSAWSPLGGVVTSEGVVAANTDGRMEVFARGTDNALWHIWQENPHAGPWSAWSSLGGVINSNPAAILNSDGRIEVLARGTDDALRHIWQENPHAGPWSAWASLGGILITTPFRLRCPKPAGSLCPEVSHQAKRPSPRVKKCLGCPSSAGRRQKDGSKSVSRGRRPDRLSPTGQQVI